MFISDSYVLISTIACRRNASPQTAILNFTAQAHFPFYFDFRFQENVGVI